MKQSSHSLTDCAGALLIIAAPSGAGKSSLVGALIEHDDQISLSISWTTRPPRPGEVHGQHYFFTTREDFQARAAQGEFIEWATVHEHFYGTSKVFTESVLSQGRDLLLEIDWQGAAQIRTHYPQACGIFILPPSFSALEERLQRRGQDSEAVIQKRLAAARGELAHAHEFDYVIINQDFSLALNELRSIVTATRLRYAHQNARHAGLFEGMGVGRSTQ